MWRNHHKQDHLLTKLLEQIAQIYDVESQERHLTYENDLFASVELDEEDKYMYLDDDVKE